MSRAGQGCISARCACRRVRATWCSPCPRSAGTRRRRSRSRWRPATTTRRGAGRAYGATLGASPEGSLSHWLALIDIADSNSPGNRGESLHYIEDLAVHGRLDPTLLHRIATVLDALAYDVPIPLWEAASRTPQPAGGFLPETGVLSELQDAAKKQRVRPHRAARHEDAGSERRRGRAHDCARRLRFAR